MSNMRRTLIAFLVAFIASLIAVVWAIKNAPLDLEELFNESDA